MFPNVCSETVSRGCAAPSRRLRPIAMEEMAPPAKRKTGRPRGFDRDEALDAAMRAFWAHGYETTSVADLTAAMGIKAPALYGAFGDKRRLFLEAAARYRGDAQVEARTIAEAMSAKAAAELVLHGAVERFTDPATPPGCLLASSTATGSDAAAEVRDVVAGMRNELRTSLRARIERDIGDGRLPPDADPQALADGTIGLIQGLSAAARDGLDRMRLDAMVRLFLQGWP